MQRPATIAHRTSLYDDAVAIVEAEYASDLSLDDIARRVASSRRQLQRSYAEIGATTFREHLTAVRMDRAADMLASGALTVREVAHRVGYRQPAQFAKAFRIARDAGLLSVPHAGELRGIRSVIGAVESLGADRLGHGVRSVEDPVTVRLLAERGVVLEVCPASNVALGVAGAVELVPVRELRAAGVPTEGLSWQEALDSGMLEVVRAGRLDEARQLLRAIVAPPAGGPSDVGDEGRCT